MKLAMQSPFLVNVFLYFYSFSLYAVVARYEEN